MIFIELICYKYGIHYFSDLCCPDNPGFFTSGGFSKIFMMSSLKKSISMQQLHNRFQLPDPKANHGSEYVENQVVDITAT